jgi:hypothetical protein
LKQPSRMSEARRYFRQRQRRAAENFRDGLGAIWPFDGAPDYDWAQKQRIARGSHLVEGWHAQLPLAQLSSPISPETNGRKLENCRSRCAIDSIRTKAVGTMRASALRMRSGPTFPGLTRRRQSRRCARAVHYRDIVIADEMGSRTFSRRSLPDRCIAIQAIAWRAARLRKLGGESCRAESSRDCHHSARSVSETTSPERSLSLRQSSTYSPLGDFVRLTTTDSGALRTTTH